MRKIILFLFALLLPLSALAEGFSLAGLFSDGMVLQRNTVAPIWGWAEPGAVVTVSPSWTRTRYKAKTDDDGRWEVGVSTPEAGGPFTMDVRSGKERQNSTIPEDFEEKIKEISVIFLLNIQ